MKKYIQEWFTIFHLSTYTDWCSSNKKHEEMKNKINDKVLCPTWDEEKKKKWNMVESIKFEMKWKMKLRA